MSTFALLHVWDERGYSQSWESCQRSSTSRNFKVIFTANAKAEVVKPSNYDVAMFLFDYRKYIEIPIMEEDSYEKNVVMYVVIGEPRHIAGNYRWHIESSLCICGRGFWKEQFWVQQHMLDYFFSCFHFLSLHTTMLQLVGEINSGIVGGECRYFIKAFTFIVKTLNRN